MIEMESESGMFLCVLHDRFPISGASAIRETSIDLHLREIARKVLVGLLVHLDEVPQDAKKLDKETRSEA